MKQSDFISIFFKAFPKGYINSSNDFVFKEKGNVFVNLNNVENLPDAKAKILEFCSRMASKGMPYRSERYNKAYRAELRKGLNSIIDKDLDEDEWSLVYCHLGNCINHAKTMAFLKSGCDMSVLKKECKEECMDNCPVYKNLEKKVKEREERP